VATATKTVHFEEDPASNCRTFIPLSAHLIFFFRTNANYLFAQIVLTRQNIAPDTTGRLIDPIARQGTIPLNHLG